LFEVQKTTNRHPPIAIGLVRERWVGTRRLFFANKTLQDSVPMQLSLGARLFVKTTKWEALDFLERD
jgi:hypothetical protein